MYFDSAILVKLLVREEDSDWFYGQIANHELWSSELALAEVRQGILIKEWVGQISVVERKAAFGRFDSMREDEWLRFHPLSLAVVGRAAGSLVSCHPEVALRSLEAILLATALIHPRGSLCATDSRLRAAAQRIGVQYLPEEISEIAKN